MLVPHWLEALRASWSQRKTHRKTKRSRRKSLGRRLSAEVLEYRAAPSDSLGVLIGSSLLAGLGLEAATPAEANGQKPNDREPSKWDAPIHDGFERGRDDKPSLTGRQSDNELPAGSVGASQFGSLSDSIGPTRRFEDEYDHSRSVSGFRINELRDLLSSSLHEPLPQEIRQQVPSQVPPPDGSSPPTSPESPPASRGANSDPPPGGLSSSTGGNSGNTLSSTATGESGSEEFAGANGPTNFSPTNSRPPQPVAGDTDDGRVTNPESFSETAGPTDPPPRVHGEIEPLQVQAPNKLVQVRATDSYAHENGNPGEFTIRRTHAGGELTVGFEIGGTATEGRDYQHLSRRVTFEPGESRKTIQLDPIDDLIPDSGETITLTITSVSDEQYAIDPTHQSDTVTIYNTESGGAVWIETDLDAYEDVSSGAFAVHRDGTVGNLTVNYTIDGSATPEVDYDALSGSVTIYDMQSYAIIPVNPIHDSFSEETEEVHVSLSCLSDEVNWFIDPVNDDATVQIFDDEASGGSGGSGGSSGLVWLEVSDELAHESGQQPGTFTIHREVATSSDLTVNYSISGSASSNDYVSLNGTVVIPANMSSTVVTITPTNDLNAEATETVILTLDGGTGYSLGTPIEGAVSIVDNDTTINVIAEDASASEAGPGSGQFKFTRNGYTGDALTVNYAIEGTATADMDYASLSGSVTFAAGFATVFVDVAPLNDNHVEGSESIKVTLSPASNYKVGTSSNATVNISDNDAAVTVSASDDEAHEANEGPGTFTLTRSGATSGELTVSYVIEGTATSDNDYAPLTGSVTFSAGATEAIVTVSPEDDALAEATETVILRLAQPGTDYEIGAADSATVEIIDNDDVVVTISASDDKAHEANGGTGEFTVTRNGTASTDLTVYYTIGGTAAEDDYVGLSGSVTILAGQTDSTITITPVHDLNAEPKETVILTLEQTTSYIVGNPNSATVDIIDNDTVITVDATDPEAYETGTDPGIFTLTRSGYLGEDLVVFYSIAGSATPGSDYTGPSSSATILAGQASVAVIVTPIDDSQDESSETVALSLLGSSTYTLGLTTSDTVTVFDNDAIVTIEATDPDAYETEEDSGTFTVTRTGDLNRSLTVSYTVAGTAISGDDYAAVSNSITFGVGQATATITIEPVDDSSPEPKETVIVSLNQSENYQVSSPEIATVTLFDNDTVVKIEATDPVAHEAGEEIGTFTVTREGYLAEDLIVYLGVGGTATPEVDYLLLPESITILAGQTTASVTVTPVDDLAVEVEETVELDVTFHPTYKLGDPVGATVTIIDNDTYVWVEAIDPYAHEYKQEQGHFVIGRDSTEGDLRVYFTAEGWATPDADYSPLPESVIIPDGETEVIVWVKPYDDSVVSEGDEDVELILTVNAGYSIDPERTSDIVTIYDNESAGGAVRIVATDDYADEVFNPDPDLGKFTLTRSSAFSSLTVTFTVSGTAIEGSDYETIQMHEVTFAAGAYEAEITITPLSDALAEGSEEVEITLTGVSDSAFEIESTALTALVTIADDESPGGPTTVTINASDDTAFESGSTRDRTGQFTIGRDDASGGLTVYYTVSGTAAEGLDYESLGVYEVHFSEGQSEATITVTAIDDSEGSEGEQTVVLTLAGGAYTIGILNTATVTIQESGLTSSQSNNADGNCSCSCGCPPPLRVDPSGQLLAELVRYFGSVISDLFPTYASNENPHPIKLVDVHLPDANLPNQYEATINFGGIVNTVNVAVPTEWTSGEVARLALQVDASTLATGRYEYTVTLTPKFSDGQGGYTFGTPMTHTGGHEVFNRRESVFGNRMGLPILSELKISTAGVSLLRGNGTAAWYEADGSGGFITPDGTFSTLSTEPDGNYALHLHEGGTQIFDPDGLLIKIIDRNENETNLTYIDGNGDGFAREVFQIADPVNRTLTYDYVGGLLDSITDSDGREYHFGYDSLGRLTSMTAPDPDDAGGLLPPETTFTYNSANLLETVTDPEGKVTTITYGSDLRVRTISYPEGVTEEFDPVQIQGLNDLILIEDATGSTTNGEDGVTYYQTDGYGFITQFKDPEGNITTTERNEHGQPVLVTNALGETTRYVYDHHGRLLSTTYHDGTTEEWSYDESNHELHDPVSSKDRLGHRWYYRYDAVGNLLAKTDPLGGVAYYTYDSMGLMTSMTLPDPDGSGPLTAPVTTFEYDPFGQLERETFADGSTRAYVYDINGYLLSETDELGRTTEYEYDNLGRMVKVTLPDPDAEGLLYESPTSMYGYDAMGRLISETDARGNETTYEYDGRGQLIRITLPAPGVPNAAHGVTTIEYEYDDDGNLISEKDPRGKVTHYAYDLNGNLKRVTLPYLEGTDPEEAPATIFTYDALNRLASEMDARGTITTYTYDSNGYLYQVTVDNDRVTTYDYDALGNLLSVTLPDPDGAGPLSSPAIASTYDALGNLLTETDALNRVTTYTYDALYRLTSVERPDPDGGTEGPTTFFEYDIVGNLVKETDAQGSVTRYEYDAAGQLVKLILPDPDNGSLSGPVYQYEYDRLGRVVKEYDPLAQPNLESHFTAFTYDANGNLLKATDAEGRVTRYAYDALNRQYSIKLPDPNGDGTQAGPETLFTYDEAGNILTETDSLGRVTVYTFDNIGRLETATYPDHNLSDQVAATYRYAYDDLGRLVSETDPLGNKTQYAYDSVGNRTKVTLPDLDGEDVGDPAPFYEYRYDFLNRLESETDPLGHTTSYEYDAAGQLVSMTDPLNRTTTYGYDGLGRRTTIRQPDPNGGSNGPLWTYIYDDLGRLTDILDPDNGYTSYEYDNLGRTIWMADPSEVWIEYAYDLAGRQIAVTDTLNQTTTFTYDDVGNLLSVTEPDPDGTGSIDASVTYSTYDKLNRVVMSSVTLGQGQLSTFYSYDTEGNLLTETDPEGGVTEYAYDVMNRLLSLTDPVDNTTEWAFDYEGRVLTETNALNAVRSFAYDAHGRLIERTDRLGRVREFDYDDLGQLIEERWLESDGLTLVNTLTWSYDAGSQQIGAGDDDSGYTLDYDVLGRLIEINNSLTLDMPDVVQNYQYDDLGRRTSASATVNNVADFTNTYAYDAAGRMTRVEQTGSLGGNDVAEKRVDLTYDVLGRFETIKRYEDLAAIELVATTDYTFDSAGRLTDLDHTGLGSNNRNYDYTYDSSGRITSMTTPDGSATYSYDDTDQLIGADYMFQADEDYAYDANGNRTGALYETGANNRLEADGRYTYEYDAEGNLVRKQARQILVTGADAGAGPHVLVYDGKTGEELGSFFAYDPGFTAGVRVAVGDVNGDGVADIVTSPGTGGGPHIKVFDGTKVLGGADPTGSTPLASFFADDPGVTNGVFVALGDIDGDGKAEIITGLDGGGAPIVKIFDGSTGDPIAEFNAYPGFGGGVRVAAGDINGDGKADIVTGAGPGAAPHIKVFDGANLSGPLLADFEAYTGVSQGVYVAAGDVNGDGKADIVTSPGAGIAPHVKVFSGADSTVGTPGTELASFFAYDSTNTQGVRVATTDITDPLLNDPDGRADIVTVQGAGGASEVRIFDIDISTTQPAHSFTAYGSGWVGGAFVGGTGQNAPEDVQYHFDHKNQLTRVEFYGVNNNVTKAVEFDYDVFGRLIRKRVDETGDGVFDRAEKYVYDSAGKTDPATGVPLDDVVLVFDDTGSLTNRLLHGPAIDQVFASEDAVGEILWGLADHQGTVRDVVDYDGGTNTTSVANHRKFDSFGNLTSESSSAVDFLASYTGRIYDEDVGLYYYRARWYDPKTGRFIGEDAVKDGFNWSAYVGNNPANATDPSGMESKPSATNSPLEAGALGFWAGVLEVGRAGTYPLRWLGVDFSRQDQNLENIYDRAGTPHETRTFTRQSAATGVTSLYAAGGLGAAGAVGFTELGSVPLGRQFLGQAYIESTYAGAYGSPFAYGLLNGRSTGSFPLSLRPNPDAGVFQSAKTPYGGFNATFGTPSCPVGTSTHYISSSSSLLYQSPLIYDRAARLAQFTATIQPGVPASGGEYSVSRYTRGVFEGRNIYRAAGDFDLGVPTNVDAKFVHRSIRQKIENGWTNTDLMRNGNAPIGRDGRPINLHHVLGDEPGPMVELQGSTHSCHHGPLHGLIEDGNSFRNVPGLENQYNAFRARYWRWRVQQLTGQ